MNPIYSMTLEIVLASLLLIVIAYSWRLDGRLKALRTGHSRMLEAAKELQSSVLHAENAVMALRRSADAAGRDLQAKIDEARAMAAQPMVREALREDGRSNVDFTLRRRSVL
jgi:vacuolar-type H+-ATPase subunit D/Vma8